MVEKRKLKYPEIGKYYFRVYEITLLSFLVASFVGIFPIIAESKSGLIYFINNSIFLYFPFFINYLIYKHAYLNRDAFKKEEFPSYLLLLCSFLNFFVSLTLYEEVLPIFKNIDLTMTSFFDQFSKRALLYPTFLFLFIIIYPLLKFHIIRERNNETNKLTLRKTVWGCFGVFSPIEFLFIFPIFLYFLILVKTYPHELLNKLLLFLSLVREDGNWNWRFIILWIIALILAFLKMSAVWIGVKYPKIGKHILQEEFLHEKLKEKYKKGSQKKYK
jgi:nitrate reductase NapE component